VLLLCATNGVLHDVSGLSTTGEYLSCRFHAGVLHALNKGAIT
jgi:hypothetical protein